MQIAKQSFKDADAYLNELHDIRVRKSAMRLDYKTHSHRSTPRWDVKL